MSKQDQRKPQQQQLTTEQEDKVKNVQKALKQSEKVFKFNQCLDELKNCEWNVEQAIKVMSAPIYKPWEPKARGNSNNKSQKQNSQKYVALYFGAKAEEEKVVEKKVEKVAEKPVVEVKPEPKKEAPVKVEKEEPKKKNDVDISDEIFDDVEEQKPIKIEVPKQEEVKPQAPIVAQPPAMMPQVAVPYVFYGAPANTIVVDQQGNYFQVIYKPVVPTQLPAGVKPTQVPFFGSYPGYQ